MNTKLLFALLCFSCFIPVASAQTSRLHQDPEVVYLKEFSKKPIFFLTLNATPLFSTKEGGRQVSTIAKNQKVELLAVGNQVYRIKAPGKNGPILGWANADLLATADPKLKSQLHQIYERQVQVKALIANKEVAIGMTIDEVLASLGKPTKQQARVTQGKTSGRFEYIRYEQQDHFQLVRDPHSGQVFRQFTHSTQEIKSKHTVEFENDLVSAIELSEDHGPERVKVIPCPLFFNF